MDIRYRDATPADVPEIDRVFRQSFCDTFAHLYSTTDLESFLAQFTHQAWVGEIDDRAYAFRLAEADGSIVGYAKLGPLVLPVQPRRPAIELRQIYLLHEWHGRGIARTLMQWIFEEARRRGKRELYLTVYTDNHRARRLYESYGFEEVGPYAFMVGEQADEDIIMRAQL